MGTAAMPRRRPAAAITDDLPVWAGYLPLAATIYSGVLAMLHSFGFPLSTGLVVAIEVLLLMTSGVLVFRHGLQFSDGAGFAFLFGTVVLALYVSLVVDRLMVEVIRSGFIIGMFALLGQRMDMRTIDRTMLILGIIVGVVLIIEIATPELYVTLFHPAAFYEATRGIETSEYNNTGLFNTATSYQGRFSFGFFSVPRTSSIFLEQISNANFAIILAVYISARWAALSVPVRTLLLAVVTLIIVSTNSRFGSAFVVMMAVGFFVFPLLRREFLALAILAVWGIVWVVNMNFTWNRTDDLIGRLSFIGYRFGLADWDFFLGANALSSLGERDSGYTYVIGISTIFGFLGLMAFILLYPRGNDASSRRFLWGFALYLVGQLLISSTSPLSIKTAALLWAMAGAFRVLPMRSETSDKVGKSAP